MKWRREAFERLPEFRRLLQEEQSPYSFFGELVEKLNSAYKAGNEDIIKRIYGLVFWCINDAPRGKNASDDIFTIVTCSFLEHLPAHKLIRQDIGTWFYQREIIEMTEIFHYHGTDEQYQ